MAKTVTLTPEFPALLRLIDERSAAFRAAVASATSLEEQVPTCPEWTLLDLVQHLGKVHRFWAATVAAGPADAPLPRTAPAGPPERAALLAWSAESTEQLLSALRESGPDRGCWTWWGTSQSSQTCGAVARQQVELVRGRGSSRPGTSAPARHRPRPRRQDPARSATSLAGPRRWNPRGTTASTAGELPVPRTPAASPE